MTKTGKPPWETYLEWDVLGKYTPGGFVIYEITIKVRPEGLLAIIKARKADEGIVAFGGARNLAGLSRVVRDKVNGEETPWKADAWFKT